MHTKYADFTPVIKISIAIAICLLLVFKNGQPILRHPIHYITIFIAENAFDNLFIPFYKLFFGFLNFVAISGIHFQTEYIYYV